MLLGARQFFERRGAPTPPLPYDAEVEYLESDGDQYISGFYTYDGTETSVAMSIEWMKIASVPSGQNFIVGVASDTITNVSGPRFAQYQNGTRFSCDSGGWLNLGLLADSNIKYKTDVLFQSPDTISASMNGGTTSSGNRNFYVVQGTYILLFRITSSNKLIGRIYSAKFIIDGTLVRDMIPVRFTNELGQSEGAMYDRVSGQLFRNQGTGNFIVGRDTNPISARSYVNDGLVAMWDGIENAGWGTHDPNATVWKDLVSGTSMSLPSGVSVSESAINFSSNASLSYPISSALASALGSADVTIEFCGKIVPYNAITNRIIFITSGTEIYIYTPRSTTSSQNYLFYNYYGRSNSTANMLDANGECEGTIALTCATNGMNGVRYKNGSEVNSATFTTIPSSVPTSLTSSLMTGARVNRISIYSRALTAAEIAANYAVDKARFNLP